MIFLLQVLNFATDTMHGYMDMSVVCILSHGENGTIICTNGEKIEIEAILNRFNNQVSSWESDFYGKKIREGRGGYILPSARPKLQTEMTLCYP